MLKQVDGLTLRSKKDFAGCSLINVLRMFFVCVGFIRMKEFYNATVLVSCSRNVLENAREKFENREVPKYLKKTFKLQYRLYQ